MNCHIFLNITPLNLSPQCFISSLTSYKYNFVLKRNPCPYCRIKHLHVNLSDIALNIIFQQQLMSSLEKRELQFSNVIDRGEALIAQHHPATKTIEAHLQVCWRLGFIACFQSRKWINDYNLLAIVITVNKNSQKYFRECFILIVLESKKL